MRTIILALAIACSSCAFLDPTPDPPPGPDPYAVACENLAAIGCDEGKRPNCAVVMRGAQEARITDMRPTCLAVATTKEAARTCGSVRCP